VSKLLLHTAEIIELRQGIQTLQAKTSVGTTLVGPPCICTMWQKQLSTTTLLQHMHTVYFELLFLFIRTWLQKQHITSVTHTNQIQRASHQGIHRQHMWWKTDIHLCLSHCLPTKCTKATIKWVGGWLGD